MQNEDREPPISRIGYRVYALLGSRGGVLRLRPLLRDSGLDDRRLVAAISELVDRYRIKITWSKGTTTPDPTPVRAPASRQMSRTMRRASAAVAAQCTCAPASVAFFS